MAQGAVPVAASPMGPLSSPVTGFTAKVFTFSKKVFPTGVDGRCM